MTEPSACGTYAGWFRHYRAEEQPCEPCRQAQVAYGRALRAAHSRAQARLAEQYRDVFDALLAEEKAREGLS